MPILPLVTAVNPFAAQSFTRGQSSIPVALQTYHEFTATEVSPAIAERSLHDKQFHRTAFGDAVPSRHAAVIDTAGRASEITHVGTRRNLVGVPVITHIGARRNSAGVSVNKMPNGVRPEAPVIEHAAIAHVGARRNSAGVPVNQTLNRVRREASAIADPAPEIIYVGASANSVGVPVHSVPDGRWFTISLKPYATEPNDGTLSRPDAHGIRRTSNGETYIKIARKIYEVRRNTFDEWVVFSRTHQKWTRVPVERRKNGIWRKRKPSTYPTFTIPEAIKPGDSTSSKRDAQKNLIELYGVKHIASHRQMDGEYLLWDHAMKPRKTPVSLENGVVRVGGKLFAQGGEGYYPITPHGETGVDWKAKVPGPTILLHFDVADRRWSARELLTDERSGAVDEGVSGEATRFSPLTPRPPSLDTPSHAIGNKGRGRRTDLDSFRFLDSDLQFKKVLLRALAEFKQMKPTTQWDGASYNVVGGFAETGKTAKRDSATRTSHSIVEVQRKFARQTELHYYGTRGEKISSLDSSEIIYAKLVEQKNFPAERLRIINFHSDSKGYAMLLYSINDDAFDGIDSLATRNARTGERTWQDSRLPLNDFANLLFECRSSAMIVDPSGTSKLIDFTAAHEGFDVFTALRLRLDKHHIEVGQYSHLDRGARLHYVAPAMVSVSRRGN